MTSFRSNHYPRTKNGVVILQEYAMRQYAWIAMIVMIGSLVRASQGLPLMGFALGGMLVAMLLGNAIAYVQLRKKYAEIFFVKDHFALISIHEIVFKPENKAFPLLYANPRRNGDTIQLTFNDQIIQLEAGDWDDFDLIWEWLSQAHSGNLSS